MGIWCWGCTFSCDWTIGSGNESASFGAGVGIGWAGVCLGNGIGWFVLIFLLSPALPWPNLGLGIGCVGGPLSTGCVGLVGGMLCVGSVGNGLCLSGLTWIYPFVYTMYFWYFNATRFCLGPSLY